MKNCGKSKFWDGELAGAGLGCVDAVIFVWLFIGLQAELVCKLYCWQVGNSGSPGLESLDSKLNYVLVFRSEN